MSSTCSCLIFDFDGVIADTDSGRLKTLKEILASYDKVLADSISRKDLVGLSTGSYLRKHSAILSDEEIEEIIRKRHDLYFKNLVSNCLPYADMKEVVGNLHRQFQLAVVTTNSIRNIDELLRFLEIHHLFNWIIGREQCEINGMSKTYQPIADLIGKKVEECIVIEDSDEGLYAAIKEGYFCIRFDPEQQFKKGEENLKVSSYKELEKTIINLTGVNLRSD